MALFLNGYVIGRSRHDWVPELSNYRGVESIEWWPLRNLEDPSARLLTESIDGIAIRHPAYEMYPVASADEVLLERYHQSCSRLGVLPLQGMVCASPVKPLVPAPSWLSALRETLPFLGIDLAYPSGSYSFIQDGWSTPTII